MSLKKKIYVIGNMAFVVIAGFSIMAYALIGGTEAYHFANSRMGIIVLGAVLYYIIYVVIYFSFIEEKPAFALQAENREKQSAGAMKSYGGRREENNGRL